MKMKAFLMFVLLFLCSMGTKAQDLGANYNENIDYPITEIEMLKQSKVTWVRGFVNIPNLFLQNENGKIRHNEYSPETNICYQNYKLHGQTRIYKTTP